MLSGEAQPLPDAALDPLVALLGGRRVCVLTGAGVSTESGIPDYRGPETARRARNPIQFSEFVKDDAGRRRYWARAFVGWPRFSASQPNASHQAIATLQGAGVVTGLITQNVDRLHQAAGSRDVIELHGALHEVICLSCRALSDRAALQERLSSLNPGWQGVTAEIAPDGDAELDATSEFVVAACEACGGHLKPHVVFFGEGVPRERVRRAFALVDDADVLLVAGTSLTVFSGFRFARHADRTATPIAIVNLGPTRADELATLRLEASTGQALSRLAAALGAGGGNARQST